MLGAFLTSAQRLAIVAIPAAVGACAALLDSVTRARRERSETEQINGLAEYEWHTVAIGDVVFSKGPLAQAEELVGERTAYDDDDDDDEEDDEY